MDAIRRFVEAFNGDDVEGMQAACTDETVLIDDFPPHEWSGRHATTAWYREMAGMAAGFGMSDWSVTLGEPRHAVVTDGNAYVAVPADVRWSQDAIPSERSCTMAASLRLGSDGWRISSLAWAWG